jgi:hypothetical protein
MTSVGVEGTAGFCHLEASLTPAARAPLLINRGDERLGPRYIELRYPQAPAGVTPYVPGASGEWSLPCVDASISMFASLIGGADGTSGRTWLDTRLRVRLALIGTA